MTAAAQPRWAVGIDMSLTSTAVAAQDMDTGDLFVQRVRSAGKASDTLYGKVTRYRLLANDISALAIKVRPVIIAIEGAQFSTSKDTSAHRRAGVWWRTVDLCAEAGFTVVEVAPSSLKKWATGKGNANKELVLAAAVRKWPDVVNNNDEADAAWLADLAAYLAGGSVRPTSAVRDAIASKVDLRGTGLEGHILGT